MAGNGVYSFDDKVLAHLSDCCHGQVDTFAPTVDIRLCTLTMTRIGQVDTFAPTVNIRLCTLSMTRIGQVDTFAHAHPDMLVLVAAGNKGPDDMSVRRGTGPSRRPSESPSSASPSIRFAKTGDRRDPKTLSDMPARHVGVLTCFLTGRVCLGQFADVLAPCPALLWRVFSYSSHLASVFSCSSASVFSSRSSLHFSAAPRSSLQFSAAPRSSFQMSAAPRSSFQFSAAPPLQFSAAPRSSFQLSAAPRPSLQFSSFQLLLRFSC